MSRSVVSFPPEIVSRPLMPSRWRWSTTAWVRETSRVSLTSPARASWNSGRTPAHTRSARAAAEAGHEPLAVVEHRVDLLLRHRDLVRVGGADVGRADHAHGADRDEDVAVRGHRAAVDHRVHQPVVHRDHDPLAGDDADVLDAGHVEDLGRPRARGVEDEAALDVEVLARLLVAHARAGDGAAGDVQVGHAVVGEDARAVGGGAARERPHGLPRVDRRVGDGERAPDAGVQPRLAAQRLGDVDLLRRQLRLGAAGEELVAVRRVVVGRGDEQPARVLDAVRDDLAEDRVLHHALLGGDGVLDDVAAAGVQQAVEAAARALGEVAALDEHHVEAPQRGVPGDPGACGAAADDEDVGL